MSNLNTPDPEQLKRILLAREHARADAWLRKDRKALEALLSSDFVEINSAGRFDRNEVLDHLFPSRALHTFIIEDPSLRMTGDSTAELSYRCRESLTTDGKLTDGMFRVFATYRRYNNQYQLAVWEIRPVN